VSQLVGLGHKPVTIKTETDLVSNLKAQLEKHNKTTFTASEFDSILIHLTKGNIFDKAKILRDKYVLQKDNGITVNQFYLRLKYPQSKDGSKEYNYSSIRGKQEQTLKIYLAMNNAINELKEEMQKWRQGNNAKQ
jgi:type I restriction enzyme R subunit